jgi:hypothetical protein
VSTSAPPPAGHRVVFPVPTIFRKSKSDSDLRPFRRNVIVLPDCPGPQHARRNPTFVARVVTTIKKGLLDPPETYSKCTIKNSLFLILTIFS